MPEKPVSGDAFVKHQHFLKKVLDFTIEKNFQDPNDLLAIKKMIYGNSQIFFGFIPLVNQVWKISNTPEELIKKKALA